MNVQLENLPNCITVMRVEVPAEKVSEAWDAVVRDYTSHAKLPGYRPGKAPRMVVEGKFKKEIKEEVQKRVLSDSCREAITGNNLRVLSLSELEDVEFGEDKSLKFSATLVTAPAFELPEYKGLPVELAASEVTEAEVDAGIERLREQAADFTDVAGRPLQMDDFAVVTYSGSIDGQPVHEVVPAAGKTLSGNSDFWLKMGTDTFLPGFCEQLVGLSTGETREFDIEVPAKFAIEPLAGRKIHYSVTVNGLKEKVLPPLDDAFAEKLVPGKTIEDLRNLARTELAKEKEFDGEQAKRSQIMAQLLAKVECELPEEMVRAETRRLLGEIVRENQNHGMAEEAIREKKDELLASAGESARERLKGIFILTRIAEEEKISVTRQEFDYRLAIMASRYKMPVEKLRKQLDNAGALEKVQEEILTGKVLDFLASSATMSTTAPAGS